MLNNHLLMGITDVKQAKEAIWKWGWTKWSEWTHSILLTLSIQHQCIDSHTEIIFNSEIMGKRCQTSHNWWNQKPMDENCTGYAVTSCVQEEQWCWYHAMHCYWYEHARDEVSAAHSLLLVLVLHVTHLLLCWRNMHVVGKLLETTKESRNKGGWVPYFYMLQYRLLNMKGIMSLWIMDPSENQCLLKVWDWESVNTIMIKFIKQQTTADKEITGTRRLSTWFLPSIQYCCQDFAAHSEETESHHRTRIHTFHQTPGRSFWSYIPLTCSHDL